MKISLGAQIEEVKRELSMRADVYPRLVATRKLRPGEAEMLVERMQAVLATLETLQKYEGPVRDAIRAAMTANPPDKTPAESGT